MRAAPTSVIRRASADFTRASSSASVRGEATALRTLPVVSKLIDTSTCIGCKACEVACQEWNDLPVVPNQQRGTYQTLPTLHADYWNLIRFEEKNTERGFAWLMRKDQCMHCDDPGCLAACPAPGNSLSDETARKGISLTHWHQSI